MRKISPALQGELAQARKAGRMATALFTFTPAAHVRSPDQLKALATQAIAGAEQLAGHRAGPFVLAPFANCFSLQGTAAMIEALAAQPQISQARESDVKPTPAPSRGMGGLR